MIDRYTAGDEPAFILKSDSGEMVRYEDHDRVVARYERLLKAASDGADRDAEERRRLLARVKELESRLDAISELTSGRLRAETARRVTR